jgi:hypothetical protein
VTQPVGITASQDHDAGGEGHEEGGQEATHEGSGDFTTRESHDKAVRLSSRVKAWFLLEEMTVLYVAGYK